MNVYGKQQEMVDAICSDYQVCMDMIGPKDAQKSRQYDFEPGMNDMTNQYAVLDDTVQTLRQGIFQVLFTGVFTSGKSTLLNALMRRDVLKTSIKPETAVVTRIIFDADEKVLVYKKQIDGKGQQRVEEYTVAEFFRVYRVDGDDEEKFREVDYVQLQQRQPGIAGSLVQLVDSPGTENCNADTEAARKFAEKASAIVFLINATVAFQAGDKEYIRERYAGKNLHNLFFVINHFDGVNPDQVSELKENVEKNLREVFTTNGQFNRQLFESRVFYTNAYGSLNARLGKPTSTPYGDVQISDEQTGVPQFEEALGRFLTDDNRDKSAMAAFVPRLATMFSEARKKAEAEIARYSEGKEALGRRREELEQSMYRIERVLNGIESACKTNASEIVLGIKSAYDHYVNAVASDWDSHFSDKEVTGAIHFNSIDTVKLAFTKNEEKKKERIKPVMDAIQSYVLSKQPVLTQEVNEVLKVRMEKLDSELRMYQEQLDGIDGVVDMNEILRGVLRGAAPELKGDAKMNINVFQLVLGIVGADPDIAIGGLNGSQSNMQAIMNFMLKNVLEYIAWYVVWWPVGVGMLGVRVWQMIKGWKTGGNQTVEKLLTGMKNNVIDELRKGQNTVTMDMEKKIGGAIIRAGQTFSQSFHNELDGQKASLDDMIANMEKADFDIAEETTRTSRLLETMVQAISDVSRRTVGTQLDEAKLLSLAAGR